MSQSSLVNKVLVFLRLRKKPEPDPFISIREVRPFWDFQLFDVPDHNRRSRLVDAYYAVRRFFHYNNLFHPIRLSREIKWVFQRARRGWGDCDTWSLDKYLTKVISSSLCYLKKHKHGVPRSMFEPEDMGEDGNATEEGLKRAEARWNVTMNKMIEGFKANERMCDGLYEDELGSYPMNRPSGVSADAWEKVKNDHFKTTQLLRERDRVISEEGMRLFVTHFNSLWD